MTTDTRIESLESQVRTLKRMLFGIFGLVVVGGLLAATSMQGVPDVIRAKKFQVVTDEGKVQARLYADADGGVLGISDKNGKDVAVLGVNAHGGGMLGVADRNGKDVAEISANADGGVLLISNKVGKSVAGIYADADGGSFVINKNDGSKVALVGANAYGGSLMIANKDDKLIAVITADGGGNGVVKTYDSTGKTTSRNP